MSEKTPIDCLIDRERIRGASRMIPQGTEASALTPEQIDTVRIDLDAFRRTHKINLKELAQSLGVGHATLSEFLANKYKGNNAEFAINAEDWLVTAEQQRARPATTSFVWTNVARRREAADGRPAQAAGRKRDQQTLLPI
jgi:DNA transposition AAA+ family ATPase